MDWIKNKFDRAILLFASILLIISAICVYLNSKTLNETFATYFASYNKSSNVAMVDTKPITSAQEALGKPAKWSNEEAKFLFVGDLWLLNKQGKLEEFNKAGILHPPVPNEWLKKKGLDLLSMDVLEQDPDNDHFTNLEEWGDGTNSTNPNDPQSHPPLTNKLRLAQYIKIPFRLIFKARDGQVMQMNTVDLRQPSQFLKVGEKIAGTKFEITKLDVKSGVDNYGTPTDISEATVRNVDTSEELILVLGVISDSPDTYAVFKYIYDGSEFKVRKNGTFKLPPDEETLYKLVDISPSEAVITTPANLKLTIPKL